MARGAGISAYPPEGMEVRLIERFVRLSGQNILEVGCGDGRLTMQYAPKAATVVAIDPDPASIAEARRARASEGIRNVSFRVGAGERLHARGALFDVALFSWSL